MRGRDHIDEADQLADRIAVIDHGRVIAEGDSSQLKASVAGGATVDVRLNDPQDRPTAGQVLAQILHAPVTLHPDPAALTAQVPAAGPAARGMVAHALAELSRARIGGHRLRARAAEP